MNLKDWKLDSKQTAMVRVALGKDIECLELLICAVPTSDIRNALCDANICLRIAADLIDRMMTE